MKIKLIPIATIILLMSACSKEKKVDCPMLTYTDIAVIQKLNFNITDKNSGKDLFFSTNPQFDTSQLKLLVKQSSLNGSSFTTLFFGIDSSKKSLTTYAVRDTIFMKIGDLSTDTLNILSIKSVPVKSTNPCYNYYNVYADSVVFDKQLYTADEKEIITLKK